MTTPKFRPSLEPEEIVHLLALCKSDATALSLSIARKLSVFSAKIDNGILTPSHSSSKVSLPSALGFEEAAQVEVATREARCKYAFSKFLSNPASCTLPEIKMAQEYKYENDLMTPEEEKEYEKTVFGL